MSGEATRSHSRMALTWSDRTVVVHGLELPWVKRKSYAPNKHKVLEEGVVFVSEQTLQAVADRTTDDYLFHRDPPVVSEEEALALVQAHLAIRETRGGIHGTDRLRRLLRNRK